MPKPYSQLPYDGLRFPSDIWEDDERRHRSYLQASGTMYNPTAKVLCYCGQEFWLNGEDGKDVVVDCGCGNRIRYRALDGHVTIKNRKEDSMARVSKERPFFIISAGGQAEGHATKAEAVEAASQYVTGTQQPAQIGKLVTIVKPKTNVDIEEVAE